MSAHHNGNAPAFFFGVDGGGSRTRVRIVDANGALRGSAEGGSANVYLAFDTAMATISETLHRAAAAADLDAAACRRASLGLGLAGISSAAIGARVAACFAPDFMQVLARNDAVIACLGAHAGRDGGLVIAGTGSAALCRCDGQDLAIGGRGFLLGDDGSGAVMGRQIWRRALRAHDGLEDATPFLTALMAEFDHDPVAVIAWGRTATSGQFGRYAPRIFAAAQAEDAAALAVVRDASDAIGDLVTALMRRNAPRISLVGGLAAPLQPYLPDRVRSVLQPALRDALDGALFLAGAPEHRSPVDKAF